MNLLDRLLGHDAWTTLDLLERSRTLTDEQLDREFDLGWRTVRATLDHIIGNMEVWTDLMADGEVHDSSGEGETTLDALEVRLRAVAPRLAALARTLEAGERLDDTWLDVLDQPPTRKTYGGALAHLLTHSMHHRAQLIHMLTRLEVPGVPEGDVLGWEARGAPTVG